MALALGSGAAASGAARVEAARPPAGATVLGVNADLGQYDAAELAAVADRLAGAGAAAVRTPVLWADVEARPGELDWRATDRIARALTDRGILWVASVRSSPGWSRPTASTPEGLWLCDDVDLQDPVVARSMPPAEPADLARFAGRLAERYRDALWAIEVWPEANLLPNWHPTGPDPEAYAHLLETTAAAVRAAAPGVLVVSGAPAPTTDLGVCYLSDTVFLDRVARRGGLDAVDAVGVQAMGLRVGPHDPLTGSEDLGFRRAEALAAVLDARGAARPLWAMAWGWRVGDPATDASAWGAHDAATAARWTAEGYARARARWPWMGAMFLWQLQPAAAPDDPQWGFALWSRDGRETPAWRALARLAAGDLPELPAEAAAAGVSSARLLGAGLAAVVAVLIAGLVRPRASPVLAIVLRRLAAVRPAAAALLYGAAVAASAVAVPPVSLVGLGAMLFLGASRIALALAAVAAAVPFWSRLSLHVGPVPVRPIELLIAVAIGASALRWYADGRSVRQTAASARRAASRLTWLDGAAVVLVAWAALSPLWAEHAGPAWREWRTVILEPVLFYGLLRVASPRARAIAALDGLVLGAALAATWGLVAVALAALGAGGGAVAAEGVLRANGPYASPNNLALVLGRILPLCAAVALWGAGRRRRVYATAAIPVAVGLLATFSRGAVLVGLPVTIVYLAVVGPGAGRALRRGAVAAAAAVAAVTLLMLPFAATERVRSAFSLRPGTTLHIRVRLWESAVEAVRDHPWLGLGLDNFLYAYSERYVRRDAVQERFLSHPHNLVLDWWTRLGIPGVALLVVLVAGNLRAGARAVARSRGGRHALAVGALGVQVYALAHGLIDNAFFLVDLAVIWWVAQASLLALSRVPRETSRTGRA